MQDASNMLTSCAVSLQAFGFTVVHTTGDRNVILGMLSELIAFEQQELRLVPTALAPICQNVPDDSALPDATPHWTYRIPMDSMKNLQMVMMPSFLRWCLAY